MIKVNGETPQPKGFPILARGRKSGMLVAFTSETKGVVIESGNTNYKQFNVICGLKPLSNADWIVLEKSEVITLSNA